MGLEVPVYISDLNTAWPLGSDGKNTADDHLRNLKTAIKNSFTGITGAVTATHTQLNAATALTNGTAVASTSGTSIDFTGIPSATKRISVSLSGVSITTSSALMLQLGDSGGIETSGYLGTTGSGSNTATWVTATVSTSGFNLTVGSAAYVFYGTLTLTLLDSATNTWVLHGVLGETPGGVRMFLIGGSKATSATLDRVRLTTVSGTDVFDAGLVNIQYE